MPVEWLTVSVTEESRGATGPPLSVSAAAFAPDLTTLIIARACAGAFFGAIVPAALTYVGDTVPDTHRQPALADLMAAIAVGTPLATALAGIVADLTDGRIVFVLPSVLAAGSAFGLRGLREPQRAGRTGVLRTVADGLGFVRIDLLGEVLADPTSSGGDLLPLGFIPPLVLVTVFCLWRTVRSWNLHVSLV